MSDAPLKLAVEAALAAGRIQKERADNIGEIQYKAKSTSLPKSTCCAKRKSSAGSRKSFPVTLSSPRSPARRPATSIICG